MMMEQFINAAKKANANVISINHVSEIPNNIFNILHDHQYPLQLRISNENIFQSLGFNLIPEMKINRGHAEMHDVMSLTTAVCGISETGTIVLASSKATPSTLFFLPLIHTILLAQEDIVADEISAWEKCNVKQSRTIHFITGPSRTADIEQTLQIGMHGPKHLYILIYEKGNFHDNKNY